MKKTKGITLIALIITIIVMLILVAVTIRILIDSGLISKAKDAGQDTKSAYEEESRLGENININGIIYNSIDEYYNSSTVDDEVVEEIKTVLDLKEGEIVRYNSSIRDIDCIVLYDSTEENFEDLGVQIISLDTVGDEIEIGNGTENESLVTDVSLFNTALESYNEAYNILNSAAENLLKNNSMDVAIDARCVGSNPFNKSDVSDKINPWGFYFRDQDDNYTYDLTQMQKEVINTCNINKDYWMASYYYVDNPRNDNLYLDIRIVSGNSISNKEIINYFGDSSAKRSRSYLYSLRPVFILKEEAKIKSGEGTIESPYILEL